jgi:hypothetical protein
MYPETSPAAENDSMYVLLLTEQHECSNAVHAAATAVLS